jgi:ethanolamine permease
MVYSISELSAAMPHAGGFYSFTRHAFGPLGGFLCGVTDAIEYILTPAVVVVGVAGYLNVLYPLVPLWAWWIGCYAVFVGINIIGVELTLRVGLAITCLAVLVLLVFGVGAVVSGAFRPSLLFNMPAEAGQSVAWLPKGLFGVFAALPFAIWWYLAIESLPLAAEETHTAARDVPRALIRGIFTLLGLSLLVLVLNSGVGGGVAAMGKSAAPLAEGFQAVFALSRAGYFPRWISVTGRKTQTPHVALLLGGGVGLLCVVLIQVSGAEGRLGAALLNMAVFGAVLSYIMVMASYIKLKITRPDLPRPYVSPLGIPGAATAMLLAGVALVACFSVEAYRPAVIGVAVFLVVALVYFVAYSRTRLVAQAPEEQLAMATAEALPIGDSPLPAATPM